MTMAVVMEILTISVQAAPSMASTGSEELVERASAVAVPAALPVVPALSRMKAVVYAGVGVSWAEAAVAVMLAVLETLLAAMAVLAVVDLSAMRAVATVVTTMVTPVVTRVVADKNVEEAATI